MSNCKDILNSFGFCDKFGFIVPEPCHELDDYFKPWMDLVKNLENIRKDPTRSIQEEVREIWLSGFLCFAEHSRTTFMYTTNCYLLLYYKSS